MMRARRHQPHLRPSSAARTVLRDDRGMTLVEMLVGIGAALVVIFAGYTAMTGAQSMQTRTEDRMDALQRGRQGIDLISRDIRSQMCLPTGANSVEPAMVEAKDSSMTFYSSVAKAVSPRQPVQQRKIEFVADPANSEGYRDGGVPTGSLVETIWTAQQSDPPYNFNGAPRETRVLARGIQPVTGQPLFKYFAYDIDPVSGQGSPSDTPLVAGSTGVSVTERPRIVAIEARFLIRTKRAKVAKSSSVPFFTRVSVRTADPSDPNRSPLCY